MWAERKYKEDNGRYKTRQQRCLKDDRKISPHMHVFWSVASPLLNSGCRDGYPLLDSALATFSTLCSCVRQSLQPSAQSQPAKKNRLHILCSRWRAWVFCSMNKLTTTTMNWSIWGRGVWRGRSAPNKKKATVCFSLLNCCSASVRSPLTGYGIIVIRAMPHVPSFSRLILIGQRDHVPGTHRSCYVAANLPLSSEFHFCHRSRDTMAAVLLAVMTDGYLGLFVLHGCIVW